MKKFAIMILLILFSCSKQYEETNGYIFTSNYPLKLIVQEIYGDPSIVQSIIPPNISEHIFEPKVSDVQKLERAKVFFYVSDELDTWVVDKVENKIELISLLPQESILYHQGKSLDPHFWTSPRTVFYIVDSIARILIHRFPEMKGDIEQNAKNFRMKLQNLNKTLDSLLYSIKDKPIFLFHPSFLYLIRDFGLIYGGSVEEIPGSEPSPSHLVYLSKKIQETNTKAIFTEPQLNPHSAQILAMNSKVKVFEIDPLGVQGVRTYEEFILKNAKTFVEALR